MTQFVWLVVVACLMAIVNSVMGLGIPWILIAGVPFIPFIIVTSGFLIMAAVGATVAVVALLGFLASDIYDKLKWKSRKNTNTRKF